MQRLKKFLTQNRKWTKLTPRGLTLHDTATPGATAMDEYNYFNKAYRGAGAHGFVDWDMYIQTIPYDERANHAGGTANSRYIGIEMCVPYRHDVEKFTKVYNNTVLIFAELCITYGFNPTKDINTHHECTLKYKDTDHVDPTDYLAEYGKNADMFRKDVANKIAELEGELTMAQYDELKKEIEALKKEKQNKQMVYNYIDDNSAKIAEDANDALRAAMAKGVLKGGEAGLNLTEDLIRIHIWNYRMGLYN